MTKNQLGALFAVAAYGLWGVAPVYFKWLNHLEPQVIVAYRIVFSALFLLAVVLILNRWHSILSLLTTKRLLWLTVTATVISTNWILFIWAINNDRLLEASLAYYINPLMNVVLGFIVFSERLSRYQTLAVILAVIGVLIQVLGAGVFPWLSIAIALSFALYGVVHKRLQIDSLGSLLVETLLLSPLALIYLLLNDSTYIHFSALSTADILLLLLVGPVTAVPLLFFSGAAKRLRLSTLGFFQFMAPSLMFVLAVFVYLEPINTNNWTTFAFIWLAVVVFTANALKKRRPVTPFS